MARTIRASLIGVVLAGCADASAPAQHPDAELVLTPLWSVGEPEVLWQSPAALSVSGTRVFVLDASAATVRVFDVSDGSLATSFGRSGEGPGEFRHPFNVYAFPDAIVVADRMAMAAHTFDGEGSFVASTPLRTPPATFVALAPDRFAYTSLVSQPGDDLIEISNGNDPIARELPGRLPPESGLDDCYRLGVADGDLLVLNCYQPSFSVIEHGGTVGTRVRGSDPPVPLSDAEKELATARLEEALRASGFDPRTLPPVPYPEYTRRFQAVAFDPVWRTYHLLAEDAGVSSLLVMDEDGDEIGHVELDARWAGLAVQDDVYYALTVDTLTDLRALAAFRLDGSGAPHGR